MEAVLTPYPRDDQNKQNRIKIPKKNNTRSKFISNPSEKFDTYVGLLTTPLPHLHAPFSSYQQNQQPPLLPLPTVTQKHRSRDRFLTSKKSTKHAQSIENMGMFSGDSVFNLSPPPTSLPLPKFSVRSKLSCDAETTGVDTRATDNLRRLLRLL